MIRLSPFPLIAALLTLAVSAAAQEAPKRGDPAWLLPLPEVQADPQIPTLEGVVGHAWGQEISSPDQITRYLETLAQAAPDRTRLVRFGETYEGRPLHYLAITSPDNIKRLDAIQQDVLKLADPRALPADEAKALIAKTPAVVWLAYGVHGNEISSCDAALLTAYTLLADTRPETRKLLDQTVVIIDPSQNPDGRARFLATHRQGRGVEPSPEPFAAERAEPWPGGRFNHYLFDMNRDWYMMTQRETKARVAAYLQWQPQVFVDAHEMGAESHYYFDPPADPINSQITEGQRDWFLKIGRRQGARFDQYGFPYTTRETYDGFYPGYGSTWPTMHGALGILWEQASARGLVVERSDQTTLHYHDGVRHHYVSSLVTVEAAAADKDALLQAFYDTRASAVEEGRAPSSHDYILLSGETQARAERLAQLLVANGIEIQRLHRDARARVATADDKAEEIDVPEGAYLVPAAQPAGRLAKTLLGPPDSMGEAFIKRQLDRDARRLGDEIYDVTAWSLPMTFGVDCRFGRLVGESPTVPVEPPNRDFVVVEFPRAKAAYLVPAADEAAINLLAALLRKGHRVHVADQPFTLGRTRFGRGTLLLRVAENGDALHDDLTAAVLDSFLLDVISIDSTFVEDGAGLGGGNVSWVEPPKVLLAVGESVSPFVGHTWYLFDQVWKYPATRVPTRLLAAALDPSKGYNVLVLPNGSYDLGESTVARVKDFVRGGGTLITVGGATEWATGESVGLIASKPRERKVDPIPGEGLDPASEASSEADSEASGGRKPPVAEKDDAKPKDDQADSEANSEASGGRKPPVAEKDDAKPKDDQADKDAPKESPDPVPGAFFRANLYDDHFVTFGLPTSVDLLVNTSLILEPLKPTVGRNLVTFPDGVKPTAGFVWPATLKLLARSPGVVYQELGRGHVVGFTDDPNFRAMSPVSSRLFQNAVFFGPGH